MYRNLNTNAYGQEFDQATINAVWNKGRAVPNYNISIYRKDTCAAWICKNDYGITGEYGWEIGHIAPSSKGGTDQLNNLQPLHWKNNRHKGDNYPNWNCAINSKI